MFLCFLLLCTLLSDFSNKVQIVVVKLLIVIVKLIFLLSILSCSGLKFRYQCSAIADPGQVHIDFVN